MKKKLVTIGIASFLVLGLFVVGFNTNKTASDVCRYIEVNADFAKAYDSYDELMSDSEVIAFGTVKKVHSYIDYSRILELLVNLTLMLVQLRKVVSLKMIQFLWKLLEEKFFILII